MVDLFRGINFHHMDLFDVDGMGLLMDACAETLKTLRGYPTDPRSGNGGEEDGLSSLRAIGDLQSAGVPR